MSNLLDTMLELATAREVERERQNMVALAKANYEATLEYLEYLEAKEELDQVVCIKQEVDAEARALVLESYLATGNKKPIDGASVRVMTKLNYSLPEATEWAKDNAPALFVLDVKKFEKVAVEMGCPVVTEEQTPQATIATDLSSYLA